MPSTCFWCSLLFMTNYITIFVLPLQLLAVKDRIKTVPDT